METQYQRSKIRESLYYEHKKDLGEIPIMGVNTFLKPSSDNKLATRQNTELIRSSYDEKNQQLDRLNNFKEEHKSHKELALQRLKSCYGRKKCFMS